MKYIPSALLGLVISTLFLIVMFLFSWDSSNHGLVPRFMFWPAATVALAACSYLGVLKALKTNAIAIVTPVMVVVVSFFFGAPSVPDTSYVLVRGAMGKKEAVQVSSSGAFIFNKFQEVPHAAGYFWAETEDGLIISGRYGFDPAFIVDVVRLSEKAGGGKPDLIDTVRMVMSLAYQNYMAENQSPGRYNLKNFQVSSVPVTSYFDMLREFDESEKIKLQFAFSKEWDNYKKDIFGEYPQYHSFIRGDLELYHQPLRGNKHASL